MRISRCNDASTTRGEIVAADRDALTVQVDGQRWELPWSAVTTIAAGRGLANKTGDLPLLVMAFGIMIEREERVFVVVEGEPLWLPLTEIMPDVLPRVPAFSVWGVEAVTAAGPLVLYRYNEGLA